MQHNPSCDMTSFDVFFSHLKIPPVSLQANAKMNSKLVRVNIDKKNIFFVWVFGTQKFWIIRTWTIDLTIWSLIGWWFGHLNSDQMINRSTTRLSMVQVLINQNYNFIKTDAKWVFFADIYLDHFRFDLCVDRYLLPTFRWILFLYQM